MATPLPSAEGTMRAWLRSLASVTALTDQRQYFKVPEQDRPLLPFVLLYRVGGASDFFGQDYPDMIFETWGVNKNAADTLGRVVAAEVMAIRQPITLGNATVLSGRVNVGPIETVGTSWAKRYRIDATFHIRSTL